MQENDFNARLGSKWKQPHSYYPEDYKNELQFVFETQIAKLEAGLTHMRGAVDKSRSIPSEEVHQSIIRAYGELLKIGDMMGTVNSNLRWHNGDHSMYDGVDG